MSTFMILTRLYNMAPVLSLYRRLINYMTVNRKNNLFSKGFYDKTKVLLRLRVQNRRKKWNFPLNFRTMRKLSDLYSGIFQTQSSGCVSGLDHIRNFTNLKNLNI